MHVFFILLRVTCYVMRDSDALIIYEFLVR
jgi:hypothetical protein